MLLARLRWSAFGLRGRIVGAVLATTAISLGVAALVLLPRLESSLKNASKTTLLKGIQANQADLRKIANVPYWLSTDSAVIGKHGKLAAEASAAINSLVNTEKELRGRLGAQYVVL